MKTIRFFLFLQYWNNKLIPKTRKKKFKSLPGARAPLVMLLINIAPGQNLNLVKFLYSMTCSVCGVFGLYVIGRCLFDYYVLDRKVDKIDIYLGVTFLIVSLIVFFFLEFVIKI